MAKPLVSSSLFRINRFEVVRMVLLLLVCLLLIYNVEMLSRKKSSALVDSCLPCSCDCAEQSTASLPLDAIDSSLADCGKDDPETHEELKKDIVALLTEEISLQENVTNESLQRTNGLIIDAKRTSSHYQREAEKCNIGIEICEESREKAEVALSEERRVTALWMSRAREYGWKDGSDDFL